MTDAPYPYWRRNLFVCLFGSFTNIMAMSLLLPFLPLYVASLGVTDPAAIVRWSGIAYAAMFLSAGLAAPLWGRLADIYGRKPILLRASLGMGVCIALTGIVQDVTQLIALRLVAGFLGGYSSAAVVLVATQTPRERLTWALGMLSTGVMAGTLLGPLVGGVLPGLVGIRETFFLAAAVIFVAFLTTLLLVREVRPPRQAAGTRRAGVWASVPDPGRVIAMLLTALLLMMANMSVEPIITVYVATLVPAPQVVLTAGFVMAAAAFGSILAAPRVGRLADRVGPAKVIVGCLAACAVLLVPQAFVTNAWQLLALRFLMGVSLGGLLPSINATIRHSVPDRVAGSILGYSTSAQFAGQVIGPVLGGFVGGHFGMRAVFLATSVVLLGGAVFNAAAARRAPHAVRRPG